MSKTKQYCVAENWGRGFIEHNESSKMPFVGYPGNVWQVPAHNKSANLWISKVLGVPKTKNEAQVIVTAIVDALQDTWDADNVDGESSAEKIVRLGSKPADITLEE